VIRQEFLKIVRRRGVYATGVILTTLAAVGVIVVALIAHGNETLSYEGGREVLESQEGLILLFGVVFAILIGAQTGVWDFAHGTFRYLAMTGRPWLALYAVRIPALVAAVLVVVAPATAIGLASALVLPIEGGETVSAHVAIDYLWEIVAFIVTYALLSFGIGALLRSSGAAVAVALIANLIGLSVLTAIASLDETLGDLMLPLALERVTGGQTSVSIAAAAIALATWIAAFVGGGALRTVRGEY
jgi:hypothetical protein